MKLINLLVQELPKRGGWPDGVAAFVQEDEKDLHGCVSEEITFNNGWYSDSNWIITGGNRIIIDELADDYETAIVNRWQYESELAASVSRPMSPLEYGVVDDEWDGVGLPPVGCECEARYRHAMNSEWVYFRCVAVDCEIAFGWSGKEPVTLSPSDYEFRPIRSEADKKRDEIIDALTKFTLRGDAGDIYRAIAAGEIPHIKLSD